MSRPRILIAGIGNIFFGDDAFGVEVAQRLARRTLPEGTQVVDFGIRGLDLSFALLEAYDAVILVDAAPRGEAPGTLYVLEPQPSAADDADDLSGNEVTLDAHSMDPDKVLRLAAAMGSPVRRVLLVGCEPRPMAAGADMCMEMSAEVRAAVDEALPLVESLIDRIFKPDSDSRGSQAQATDRTSVYTNDHQTGGGAE